MENLEIFQRIGLAIAIGAAIGVERHWREREDEEGSRTAGIRTFMMIGMLGGMASLLDRLMTAASGLSGMVLTGFFVTFMGSFTLFKLREAIDEASFSVTSVIAAMLTFCLGALAVVGDKTLATAGGVALVSILVAREFLHQFLKKIQWSELRSGTILLAMTFVILPAIPTESLGPFGGISPSRTLVIVIVLAAISFCGYLAVRLFGSAIGEIIAGAIGGLISSTATTIANARLSKSTNVVVSLAAGAICAGAVSLLRTSVLVTILAPSIAVPLVPALLAGALAMLAYAALISTWNREEHRERSLKNPFDLLEVIKMALLLVGVSFFTRAASEIFGTHGLFVASGLAGLADVDAATVSVTGMLSTISTQAASWALAIAVTSNVLAKAIFATIWGSRAFGIHIWKASLLALAFAVLCVLVPILVDLATFQ